MASCAIGYCCLPSSSRVLSKEQTFLYSALLPPRSSNLKSRKARLAGPPPALPRGSARKWTVVFSTRFKRDCAKAHLELTLSETKHGLLTSILSEPFQATTTILVTSK